MICNSRCKINNNYYNNQLINNNLHIMSSRRGRISIEITIIITLTNNLIPLFSLFYNCNYYNCKLQCADIEI